jgi:hypothetical protein
MKAMELAVAQKDSSRKIAIALKSPESVSLVERSAIGEAPLRRLMRLL